MNNLDNYPVPARKSLLLATVVAFLAAAVILVTVVLPAEYNIDPVGAGKILGLTALSESVTVPEQAERQEQVDAEGKDSIRHDDLYQTETIEIKMKGDEQLEYKFFLQKDEPLLYSWDSEQAEVYYEFHGEPTEGNFPEGYYKSYAIGDGSIEDHGSFVAPFTGQHGWYFLNLNESPITITLKVSGYYEWHGPITFELPF